MSKKDVSRRGFLKGIVQAAGAAGLATMFKFFPEAKGAFAGSRGSTQGMLAEGINVQHITGRTLRNAISKVKQSSEYQVIFEFLRGQCYEVTHKSAIGIVVESVLEDSPGSGKLLMWDHQGNIANSTARVVYTMDADDAVNVVGVGIIDRLPSNDTRLRVFEVEDGNLVRKDDIKIDESGNVENSEGNVRVFAASSDCTTCLQVCSNLYGGFCSLTGVVVCTLVCAPIANLACPVICGVLFILICIIGTTNNCNLICDDLGYC